MKNLLLTGMATGMCVHFPAVNAFMRSHRLRVPGNCVAAETPAMQRAVLHHLERTLRCCTRSSRGRSPFTVAWRGSHSKDPLPAFPAHAKKPFCY